MTDNVANDTSADSSAPASKKRWYVVYAYSSMRKSTQRALQECIEREDLQHLFGQILVPSEEVMESKSGRKAVTERRLFPGHVFVGMEMTDETWHLVKNTSRVIDFIDGTGNRPSPISKSEIDKIMTQIQEGVKKPCPKTLFEAGEMVRVKEGPLTDFNGNVERVNYGKSRLRVSATTFGCATPAELEFGQVEKA